MSKLHILLKVYFKSTRMYKPGSRELYIVRRIMSDKIGGMP